MCGRFNLRTSVAEINRIFLPGFDATHFGELEPRYNIAPTQPILCVVEPNAPLTVAQPEIPSASGDLQETARGRMLARFRWGLVPTWAQDLGIGNRMINARAETAAEKPSFKSALKSRRCIIPADGFYEWQSTESGKQPYEFSACEGNPLAIAGLWERNSKILPAGQTLYTCTILTTSANRFMSEIHDRMPVILPREAWDRWLDPGFSDVGAVESMLISAPEDTLRKRPVSRKLNNVRNQGADLLEVDR